MGGVSEDDRAESIDLHREMDLRPVVVQLKAASPEQMEAYRTAWWQWIVDLVHDL